MKLHFNINLTEKQKEVYTLAHSDKVKEIVCAWSRQCGKTTFATIIIIEALVTKPNGSVFYISPSFSQGRKVYRDILQLLNNSGLVKSKNSSELIIELNNGSILQFFSAKNPTAVRGQTCKSLLVIDEAAYINELTPDGQNFFHSVVKPVTKAKKPLVLLISTPNSRSGFFYEEYIKGLKSSDGIVSVKATIYDDKLISEEDIEELKRTTPQLAFRQEFLVEFIDDALTVFQGFDRQFCSYKGKEIGKNGQKIWIGIDLSATEDGDETIVTLVDKDNNSMQYKIEGSLDRKYEQIARIIDSQDKLIVCYIEANGIGEPIINEIRKLVKKNRGKIHYHTTTHTNKNEMVGDLAIKIANREIWFNELDKELYQQFGVFTYKINKNTRNITYNAKEGYHDDRIMSLMIAIRAKEDYPSTSVTSNYRLVGTRDNKII